MTEEDYILATNLTKARIALDVCGKIIGDIPDAKVAKKHLHHLTLRLENKQAKADDREPEMTSCIYCDGKGQVNPRIVNGFSKIPVNCCTCNGTGRMELVDTL